MSRAWVPVDAFLPLSLHRQWRPTEVNDMPMGTHHELVGLLLEARGNLILDVDGGGTWRLDADWRARRLLGMRVKVVGVRDGFDLLAVTRIERA